MAQATAKLNYLRIAPKKVRRIAALLKGMPVLKAEAALMDRPQRSAGPLRKLLKSAVSNAEHHLRVPKASLYVSRIKVDSGPSFKRMLPRAFGRATPLLKRTSHITIVLGSRETKGKEVEEEVQTPTSFIMEEKSSVEPEEFETPRVEKKSESEKKMARKFTPEKKGRFVKLRDRFGPRFFRRKAI